MYVHRVEFNFNTEELLDTLSDIAKTVCLGTIWLNYDVNLVLF